MKNFITAILCILCWLSASSQTVGSKVGFKAVDGKYYTGIIKEVSNGQYKIEYDGVDFEAWLTADQFRVLNSNSAAANNLPVSTATGSEVKAIQDIFNFGKAKGWSSLVQEKKLADYLARLSATDKKTVLDFLNQAKTASAKFFVLKSLMGGDTYETDQAFINELNQYPESYQQEHCLVTTDRSIIQQWEYSCSVTVVQTYIGDLCPRYAWDVKKIPDYSVVAKDPYSNPMGMQQKELLEKYGGIASVRGDYSGKYIPINDALNQLVGNILGVQFTTQQVDESLTTVFGKIRGQVDKGFDVPLLIGFVGTQSRHFILLMKYQYVQGGYQYLIYDPWDGKCGWVTESNFIQGSLYPLLTNWKISLDYYYIVL